MAEVGRIPGRRTGIAVPDMRARGIGEMLERVALLCVAAALACAGPVGCGGTRGRGQAGRLPPVRVIYESHGEIQGLSEMDGGEGRAVAVWEWLPPWRTGVDVDQEQARGNQSVRLLRLDAASGNTRIVHKAVLEPSEYLSLNVGMTEDGRRIASSGTVDAEPYAGEEGLFVMDNFGDWTLVTRPSRQTPICPRWSPDGSALAFLSVGAARPGVLPVDAVVLPVPRPARLRANTVLTDPGAHATGVEWGADGKRLFLAVYRPDRCDSYIESVDWPSLRRRTIMTAGALGTLSVARCTGEVVFVEDPVQKAGQSTPNAHTQGVLWRLSPDGALSKTPVHPDSERLFAAAVSPDGKRFAVVPRQEGSPYAPHGMGLVVYSIMDGTRHEYQEFAEMRIVSVAWVLSGRALVVAEQGKRVWVVEVEAAGASGTSHGD